MPSHEDTVQELVAAANARRNGDTQTAIRLTDQLLSNTPDHVEALALRAILATESGDFETAKQCLTTAIETHRGNAALHAHLGHVQLAEGQPAKALASFEAARARDEKLLEAWNGLGASHRMLNDVASAEQSYRHALKLDPGSPIAASALGMMAASQRQYPRAREYFEMAVDAAPRMPEAYYNLANVLAEMDELEASAARYLQALKLAPSYVDAWVSLALVQETQGQFTEALKSLDQALAIYPEHKRAWFLKANLLEQLSDFTGADAALSRGFALDDANPHFHLVKARLERRTGNHRGAQQRLESLSLDQAPAALRGQIETERGRVADALGDSARAFAAYTRANELSDQSWSASNPGPNEFLQQLEQISHWLAEGGTAGWREHSAAKKARTPVFVVGFPRSGTTLLDRILSSHGDFCVMEESGALGHLTQVVNEQFGGYPHAIRELDSDVCHQLRHNYWANATRLAYPSEEQVLVDKLPMNTVHVGLIHRLFPSARIVFAVRHPLDVILSCFMQAFESNAAMANFYSLGQAAETYSRVLDIWLQYEATLPLQVHYVKYEDVVQDFESTIRKLTTFLNRPYRDAMSSYYETRGTAIKTPSYHQVSRPIYREARYRWRRYEEFLAPSAVKLAPYLAKFGYEGP